MLMSPLAEVGFQVNEARAEDMAAYVPLKPSFDAEYEAYPEINVVVP
jgi:hypothetical protein